MSRKGTQNEHLPSTNRPSSASTLDKVQVAAGRRGVPIRAARADGVKAEDEEVAVDARRIRVRRWGVKVGGESHMGLGRAGRGIEGDELEGPSEDAGDAREDTRTSDQMQTVAKLPYQASMSTKTYVDRAILSRPT